MQSHLRGVDRERFQLIKTTYRLGHWKKVITAGKVKDFKLRNLVLKRSTFYVSFFRWESVIELGAVNGIWCWEVCGRCSAVQWTSVLLLTSQPHFHPSKITITSQLRQVWVHFSGFSPPTMTTAFLCSKFFCINHNKASIGDSFCNTFFPTARSLHDRKAFDW